MKTVQTRRARGEGCRATARPAPFAPPFIPRQRYLSFLIGGGNDITTLRLELLIHQEDYATLPRSLAWVWSAHDALPTAVREAILDNYRVMCAATGHWSEIMRREIWDIEPLVAATARARIRIVDEATGWFGHINIDDIRFSDAPPAVSDAVIEVRPPGAAPSSATIHVDPDSAVWGFADLHTHPMATLGFGGKLIAGHTGPNDSISALRHCESLHGPGGTGLTGNSLIAVFSSLAYAGSFSDNPVTASGHDTSGYPEFQGWPRFTTMMHQTVHWEWIRRAWEGGLRLMSALAVNTELLGKSLGADDFSDNTAISKQVAYIQDMSRVHSDWMEIAYSAADARRIIRSNRLAVIIGIEVDRALGVWVKREELPPDAAGVSAAVTARLDYLYGLGVRQLNPIHVANNAFGGCSIYVEEFNVSNHFLSGTHFDVEGRPDVDFRINEVPRDASNGAALVGEAPSPAGYRSPDYAAIAPGQGHGNRLALTDAGEIAIREMMRRSMLIDIDHMAHRTSERVLEIAEANRYPVISAHTTFRELSPRKNDRKDRHKWSHEGEKTRAMTERIRDLGGMVAPIMSASDSNSPAGSAVANDCCGSSKSWAQEYLYAIDVMGGKGVGIGTDRNVLLNAPGPRFGPWSAWGLRIEENADARLAQADAQRSGVRYDSPIRDYRFYRFEPARTITTPHEPYRQEERDIWEAIAMYKSRVNPDQAWQPDIGHRSPYARSAIPNIAKGFYRAEDGAPLDRPLVDPYNIYAQQRAAFLAARNMRPGPDRGVDPDETVRLYPLIAKIWHLWQEMDGPNPPLRRYVAGNRDFDYNIDGFAHYGMFPDFLQDLSNNGLTADKRAPLFRSAEDYIRTWETCEARSRNIV